jgi:hypothetical protein
MRKLLAAAMILVSGCARTVVDVGAAENSDGGDIGTIAHVGWTHNESNCPAEAAESASPCSV